MDSLKVAVKIAGIVFIAVGIILTFPIKTRFADLGKRALLAGIGCVILTDYLPV